MTSNWEIVKAEDFCFTVTDGTHDSPKAKENGHYLITSKHLAPYNIDFSSAKKISEEDYQKVIKRSPVEQWDILFSMIGTIGITYLEKNIDIDYACKNMGIFKFNGDKDKAYWLYHYLQTPQAKEYILGHLRGTTQQYLPLGSLRDFPIQVPSAEIRNNITLILRSLDDRIAVNTAINENLEQQAQALFKAWFVDFEPFGGVMPDDWSECILDSMCSLIIKGITPKYNEHSAQLVINQKCVRNHQIDLSLARCHEPKKVNEKWLQYGDIVVNSTGTGTLGRAAQVLFTPNNMTVDSHVTIIRASKQEYIYYLGLWATSHEHDFEMLQTGSTGQTDLPRERLKQMQIVLPSDSILSSFSKVIKPIADIRIQKQQENQRLSALRDTLLPKLMNGEIDVSAVQI